MVWSQWFEQHSASFMQALLFAVHETHWPLEHFCPDEQVETQVPLVASQCRHWLVSHGAGKQVEPQTLAVRQQVLFRQVLSMQQSPFPLQP